MPRYIDAEKIKYERHDKIGLGIDYSINEPEYYEVVYKKQIDQTPTADVQEVRHGKWIYDKENECWYCSLCEYSALNNYRGLSVESNYCPHCGAKMDGE